MELGSAPCLSRLCLPQTGRRSIRRLPGRSSLTGCQRCLRDYSRARSMGSTGAHPRANEASTSSPSAANTYMSVARASRHVRELAAASRSRASVTRFDQHTQLGRPLGAASFANRLMRRAAARRGIEVPAGWWDARHAEARDIHRLFCAAKARVGAMECRVVAFNDDSKGVRSSIAEIYVHAQLATPYNDFSTS